MKLLKHTSGAIVIQVQKTSHKIMRGRMAALEKGRIIPASEIAEAQIADFEPITKEQALAALSAT